MKRIVALPAFVITVTAGLVQAQDVSERLKGASFAQQRFLPGRKQAVDVRRYVPAVSGR
jgi:hypothetical protein